MSQNAPMERPIVRRIAATVDRNDALASEVHFHVAGNTRMHIGAGINHVHGYAYLSQQIMRRPNDLRLHMQRIHLSIDSLQKDKLPGALIDLFIILGEAGHALKQRCLSLTKDLLDDETRKMLESAVRRGIQPDDPDLSRYRGTVLSRGFSGTSTLVTRLEQRQTSGYRNTYEEATARLEYGQLDEARRVLEDGVRQQIGDPRLLELLLEIYRRSGDVQAIEAMRVWLLDRDGELPVDF